MYHNILIYVPQLPTEPRKDHQYSITVLIIDALSQLNFKRSFPATWTVLRSLQGVLYEGHNRVGHNSYPNVMALLSGEITAGVPELKGEVGPEGREMYYIDLERQPLIQSLLRRHGYLTMQMEDTQDMGDFNRKGIVGFKSAPADIYYRAAFLAMVEEKYRYKYNYPTLGVRNWEIGEGGCFACLQEQMLHKYQLPAIHDFIDMYKHTPTFTFIHLVEYLHNDLNMAKHYDRDLAHMIKSLHNSSALKNTFLMLMGDHGWQRTEPPFIFTKQGKTEMNMPAFYILPPTDFSSKYPEKYKNLIKNSKSLTTFFDINQMMRDILSLASNISVSQLFQGFEGHGSSLFSNLSARTCEEAEIPEDYCSCLDGVSNMDTRAENLQLLARALLTDLNNHLKGLDFCQGLTLSRLENASIKKAGTLTLLTFLIYVEQREAIFEAQVECHDYLGDFCHIKLVRMDWYAMTDDCIKGRLSQLNQVCICKE